MKHIARARITRIALGALTTIVFSVPLGARAQTAINQATAMAGTDYGYLQDAPGFPVAIVQSGSYKLTGDLIVPAGVSGIEVYAKGVTIDMNGFEIKTTAACSRYDNSNVVYCPNTLGKVGVDIKLGSVTLYNGRISGFETGLVYKGADYLYDLLVENNSVGVHSASIAPGARTLMRNLRVQTNRYSGIVGYSALVQNSTSSGNGGVGFYLSNSTVLDSAAYNNHGSGFEGWTGPLAVGRNTSWGNSGADYVDVKSMGDNINSAFTRF